MRREFRVVVVYVVVVVILSVPFSFSSEAFFLTSPPRVMKREREKSNNI